MKVTLTFTDCTVGEAACLMDYVKVRTGDPTIDADLFEKVAQRFPIAESADDNEGEEVDTSAFAAPVEAPAPRKRASRAKAAAPVPPPAPAAPVPPPAPAAPVPPPAPAAPVPPPPPPQNFNAAELVETFPQFMLHITPRLASGELTTAKLKLVTDTLGLEGLGSLATHTNLIGRAMDLLK